ncbi:MAG: homocysteine S-methyltransferase family protein, partial [Thermodesulfobacteriota bacterium]|nr:homocysteine S-methyltransferase family protein [Thermodesulfobacteriota bacterium]
MGVRGVGGCCGTTPEHIKDMARSIKPLGKKAFSGIIELTKTNVEFQEPVPLEERSKL